MCVNAAAGHSFRLQDNMSYEQQLSSAAVAECTFEEREKREGNHPSTHMPPAARHSDGISLGPGPKVKARFRDYMARPTRDTAGSASPGGSLPSGNTTSIRWFCRHCGVIGCKCLMIVGGGHNPTRCARRGP